MAELEIYRIKSCLQDYAYTSKGDWDELAELIRLAEIGRATEKAFKVKPTYLAVYINKKLTEDTSIIIHEKAICSVTDLLDWAKED